ncbi:hypothetical protein I553_3245 [Mycobacterium xenopi 4042]|uniref:Uncharacterized protein n=1 Tax=Mycobacterium xenopi 4042 TaxID=1299334 RepID=X8E399_MYCXE|nr:hypothetical protein I553_3245 [Mycobacterium xenopi 4042]
MRPDIALAASWAPPGYNLVVGASYAHSCPSSACSASSRLPV